MNEILHGASVVKIFVFGFKLLQFYMELECCQLSPF